MMELAENKRVKFFPFTHSYLIDGERTLIGVTSLMKKHGLSPDYGGIDAEVLAHAAELGSQAHQAIEDYCNGLPTLDMPLIRTFKKLGLDIISTEYLVSDNETVASSIDLVWKTGENEVAVIDMKRTSTVHKDALAWQTGIYKYLFEMANPGIKVSGCYCLPIIKGNKDDICADTCGKLVPITPVKPEQVEKLLECERMGVTYTEDYTLQEVVASPSDITAAVNALEQIGRLKAEMTVYENILSDVQDRLYEVMSEKSVEVWESDTMRVKLVRPAKKTSIDTTRLKKEHPEIAEEYSKESTVKGYCKITLKQ